MTLTLKEAAKTFADGTKAVLPTNIEVGTGEIVSLLGPSGCGKTTLLRMIAGLEQPDEGGEIWFDEDNVTSLPIERRKVGMVFQSYALFPNMSVRTNIAYGLKMQRLPRDQIDARVAEVMEMCRLEDYGERSVTALSGGQRQRVALARAFAPRPRILLLDEPLSALDAALRDTLRDELSQLLRRFEITALFVTHDQTEAMAIADQVAVMSAGRVEQMGTPEDLYRNPKSPFVAEFVGHAMELGGVVEGENLRLPGGLLPLPENDAEGCNVYVRAEDVALDENGPLHGLVEAVTFLGTHYRIAISGIGENMLYSIHSGLSAPGVGERVRISIPAKAIITIKAA